MSLSKPTQHLLTGRTPSFSLSTCPQHSYSLYIPKSHSFSSNATKLPVLVIIHGTKRQTGGYLRVFKTFCDTHSIALLVPLFPASSPEDIHTYKTSPDYHGYVLQMLDEASQIWNIDVKKVWMHGFSGGGQFVSHFLFHYPQRLYAASIGAPGKITLPASSDVDEEVDVQIVVGEKDTDTSLFGEHDNETRVSKCDRLYKHYTEELGMKRVEHKVVQGVGHDGMGVVDDLKTWLEERLKR